MDFLNPRRSLQRTEKSGRSPGYSSVRNIDRSRSAAFESRVGERLILTTVIERKALSPWYSPFSSFLAVTFAWISYSHNDIIGNLYIYRIDDNSMIYS